MKYAHGDEQGGTGGECNNLRQNRGRAHRTQFIPMREVEQTLSLPCKAPLSKPAFRHEEWKQTGFINAKAKLAWYFQEGGFWCRALAGQDAICRFEEMLWPHTLRLCCVPMCLISQILKFSPLTILIPPKYNAPTLKARRSPASTQEHPFLRVTYHPSLSIMGWRTTPSQ